MNMKTQYDGSADGNICNSLAGKAFKYFGNEIDKARPSYSTQ